MLFMLRISLRSTSGPGTGWLLAAGLLFAAPRGGRAEAPALTTNDLPRPPLIAPAAAVGTLRLRPGFHAELAAAEPQVVSPVALAFDERGRLFVAEMIDYSERRDAQPHLGRIRLLEDTRGDGVYDRSTIFADNLAWPTAVFCCRGGLLVVATPDILFLQDTHGTGRADVREVVFTGLAEGVARLNVQELANSLSWGPDQHIHGATSGEGGKLRALRHPDAPVLDLRGRDFVIDPRAFTAATEAGGGQHGLSFDDYGRRFTCNNSDHIRLFQYDDRYAGRNPSFNLPPPLASIAEDGPAAEVFRQSPDEAWRVIRTRWRVASLVTGPVEGGGRASGYFTGATGITIYRGDAFPAEYRGDAFIGECAGNLVSRKKLAPKDAGLTARRAAGEEQVEFLASTDNWFRPVQLANAPDGALYVIDMHREVVEHPWSLPEGIKKFLDLDSGAQCGRIFRIVPDGFRRRPAPRLDQADIPALVALLEHPNGWHRDTASRLLYERNDPTAAPLLRQLRQKSGLPAARLLALHALAGLTVLTPEDLAPALADPDPGVRVHALQLAEPLLQAGAPGLAARVAALTADPVPWVRRQLAFTAGELPADLRRGVLAGLLRETGDSPMTRAAVFNSLDDGAGALFGELAADPGPARRESLRELARQTGARHAAVEVTRVIEAISQTADPEFACELTRCLGEGLLQGHSSLASADSAHRLAPVWARATAWLAEPAAPEKARVAALGLLALAPFAQAGDALRAVLGTPQPEAVQLAAVGALTRFTEPGAAGALLAPWSVLGARARSLALAALLARPERAEALLQALRAGTIPIDALTLAQTKFLRNHVRPAVRELARTVLPEQPGAAERAAALRAFAPALTLPGDAAAGRALFSVRCIACHRLAGLGFAVGPDLASVRANGREKLLIAIVDPNREVAPPYLAFTLETKAGESHVGILAQETTTSVTVRQAYGREEVIRRADLRGMTCQQQSLMPEGLEAGLTPQDVANLLEFLVTAR